MANAEISTGVDTRLPSYVAIAEYFKRIGFAIGDLDTQTMTIRFANGISGHVVQDCHDALDVNDVDYVGKNGSLETKKFDFELAMLIGAALQRDGLMPDQYSDIIDSITAPPKVMRWTD